MKSSLKVESIKHMDNHASSKKNEFLAIALLLFAYACAGLAAWLLIRFSASYLISVFLAIICLTVVVVLSVQQKRISIQTIALLVLGLIFLGGGIVVYAYEMVIRPLPMDAQMKFSSQVIDPDKLNQGLIWVAVGIVSLFSTLRQSKWEMTSFFSLLSSTIQQAIHDINTLFTSPFFRLGYGMLMLLIGLFMILSAMHVI